MEIILLVVLAGAIFTMGYIIGYNRGEDNIILKGYAEIECLPKEENPFKAGEKYKDGSSTLIVLETDGEKVKYNFIEVVGTMIKSPTDWCSTKEELRNFKLIN